MPSCCSALWYEKLADRDKKVYQIWKLTFEVIEIKIDFKKDSNPLCLLSSENDSLGTNLTLAFWFCCIPFYVYFVFSAAVSLLLVQKFWGNAKKIFFFFFFLSFSFLYFFNPTYRATSTLHPASYYYWAVRSYKSCVYSRKWGCSDAN